LYDDDGEESEVWDATPHGNVRNRKITSISSTIGNGARRLNIPVAFPTAIVAQKEVSDDRNTNPKFSFPFRRLGNLEEGVWSEKKTGKSFYFPNGHRFSRYPRTFSVCLRRALVGPRLRKKRTNNGNPSANRVMFESKLEWALLFSDSQNWHGPVLWTWRCAPRALPTLLLRSEFGRKWEKVESSQKFPGWLSEPDKGHVTDALNQGKKKNFISSRHHRWLPGPCRVRVGHSFQETWKAKPTASTTNTNRGAKLAPRPGLRCREKFFRRLSNSLNPSPKTPRTLRENGTAMPRSSNRPPRVLTHAACRSVFDWGRWKL